jgi:CheY-like chemotaxis protein
MADIRVARGWNNMKSPRVTILLVEDDDIDATSVTRGLAGANITNPLVRARDGVEGLEMLLGTNGQEKLPPPFLLLVDIRLPRLDGLGLVRKIRGIPALQRTIVFMLTTSDSDRDRTAAYDENVAGYIVKSSGNDQFSKLAKMLDYYLMIVAPPPAEHGALL